MATARKYAQNTTVSVDRSQAEVKEQLRKVGAGRLGILEEENTCIVIFEVNNTVYRITAPPVEAKEKDFEKEQRRVWRSVVLLIKAKVVAIMEGISSVEREFMPDMVMPDGSTLIDHVPDMVKQAYEEGGPPRLTFTG